MAETFTFEEAASPQKSFTFEEATAPQTFTFEEAQTSTATSPSQSGPTVQELRAGGVLAPLTEKAVAAPRDPTKVPLRTTIGGEPQPAFTYGTSPEERQEKFSRELLSPIVPIPKFTINPDDTKTVAVGKSIVNFLSGMVEFAESPAGIMTAPVAGVAPKAVATFFTVDMAKSLGEQATAAGMDWDKMTDAQKAAAVTDMSATGLLSTALGSGVGVKVAREAKVGFETAQKFSDTKAPIGPDFDMAAFNELNKVAPLTAAEVAKTTEVVSASEITSTAQVPELGVRPRMGETPPLRQPGQAAETQAQVPTETVAETKAAVATLATGERLNKLGDPIGTTYRATAEDWKAWQRLQTLPLTEEGVWLAREEMKNKYGGMPPEPPVSKPAAVAPEMTGLGAASVGEVAPSGTAIKNAVGELERITQGLPEPFEKQTRKMAPVWVEAGDIAAKDPQAGAKLAAELKINPERGMTDTDSALLLRHKVDLQNRKNQAAEDSITAATPEAKAEAQARFDDLSNQLLDLLDAAKFRGIQWGREGRWRQAIAFEDFSLENMRREARMKKDAELTPEEEATVKKQHENITAKQKAEAEIEREAERQNREAATEEAVAETVNSARKKKPKGTERDLESEQADTVGQLKNVFIETGDISGEATTIRKLMELLVEREGITERLKMEDRVHEILSNEVDPTITRQQAMDLMSNYGKSKLPSPEFAKRTVRDIAAQIISVRKLLDYFQGQRPKLTGQLRDAPSDVQRSLIKMVNEAKKAFKLEGPTDNARAIKSAIDAINTRLKNRIADLKQEIATRQKIIRERSPSPYNAETLRMRAELAELQKAHAEIFGKPELTDAQRLERLEKSTDRQIAELERQLQTGEIFPESKVPFTGDSPRLAAAKARLEELKLTREFAREAAQPRPEPEVQSTEARVSSLNRQIAAIEKQIADEIVFQKGKTAKSPSTDARVIEREKKLADLKEQRQFIRERIQPKPEQAAKELEQRAESLRKKIEEVQRQIRDGDIFPKGKNLTEVEKNDLIRAREAELESLKEQRQWARESAQPKPEPSEKFLLNYLLRLRQRESQWRERIAKGDFAKRTRPKRELSDDVLKAKAEVEVAKQEFHKSLMEFQMANRSKLRKIWDGIKQTRNAFVNITSSFDLSAPRQMFLALLANSSRLALSPVGALTKGRLGPGPSEAARLTFIPLGRMFQALSSEKRSQKLEQWRKNRPNATSGADKVMEIQYTELHTTDFTRWEENAHSVLDEWAQLPIRTGSTAKTIVTAPAKIAAKGVRASNRAFITALNTTRAVLADHLLETNFKDRAPTEAELKTIGNLVNVSTGRGKLSRGVAKATGEVLWSPSLLASRVQALIGQPLWGGGPLAGSTRARWVVAKEYTRWIMSGTALMAISGMFDDKDEDEPTSSDFGKVVRGKTRIDPWAGFQQPVVLGARIATGETTSSTTGKGRNITTFGTGEVIWNFFKNKARPDIAALVKATIAAIDAGKPAKDVRVTLPEAATGLVPVPLAVHDVIAVMRDRGMDEGAIIQTLSLFGVGVNTYEDREAQK